MTIRSDGVSPVSRRSFLLGSAGALVLAACGRGDGGGDEAEAEARSTTTTTAAGGLAIARVFSPTQPAGRPLRLPLALATADGAILPADEAPASIAVRWYLEGATPPAPASIARRDVGIPTPYFPLEATFPEPGTYLIDIDVDGERAATTVDVVPSERAAFVPGPGEALIPVRTPTVADARGVDPICTRRPACPFHDRPLDAVLGDSQGKAIALIISTPAYCQTAICGPVLDLLVDRAEQHAEVLTVVHAEVYDDDTAQTTTETVKAYGLGWEPSLFLAAPDGTINARLDYTFDGSELDEVLSRLVQ